MLLTVCHRGMSPAPPFSSQAVCIPTPCTSPPVDSISEWNPAYVVWGIIVKVSLSYASYLLRVHLLTTYEQETLVYAELFAYNNCRLHVFTWWDCPTSSPTKGAVAACLILNAWPAGVHDAAISCTLGGDVIAQFSWSDETRFEASRDLAYQQCGYRGYHWYETAVVFVLCFG